jgi:hypothetical protein
MCSNYRMSNSANSSSANGSKSNGIFGAIGSIFTAATNAATKAVSNIKKNNTKTNNTKKLNTRKQYMMNATSKPVTQGVNAPTINTNSNSMKPNQTGGASSVNYTIPLGQRQPSETVMQWATTAGMPTPSSASGMRNVAHGGKRRTHRRKSKSSTSRRRTMKHKTSKRKHNKRSSQVKRRK